MPLDSIKSFFRIVAFLEGISYILLLIVAVPVKYWFGNEEYVKLLGMPHGALFITYLILAFFLKKFEGWEFKDFSIIILASILPFGTFYADKTYFNQL